MVVRAPSPHSGRSAALTRAAPARAATQPPPRPWPLLPLLLLLAGAAPAAAAVCAASGVCLAWSPVPTSSGAVTLTLSAPTATGSVALGFADTYGVSASRMRRGRARAAGTQPALLEASAPPLSPRSRAPRPPPHPRAAVSPAAVWAVSVDPSTGAASLGSHTNAGYSSSGPNLPPHPAARLLGATYAAGVLNATFLVPLPASASAANVIWALDVGPASAGPLHQHSASGALATVVLTCGATGAQCGAAAGGQGAVLRSGAVETHHGGWSRLHGLALGGFTVTVFAAALLHAAGRASGVVRLAVEPSLGSVALPRLPPALRPSPLLPGLAWGLPETLLLAGYGTTYGLVRQRKGRTQKGTKQTKRGALLNERAGARLGA